MGACVFGEVVTAHETLVALATRELLLPWGGRGVCGV